MAVPFPSARVILPGLFLVAFSLLPLPVAAADQPGKITEFVIDEDPVGKPLEDFTGTTVDGREISSERMRGKVIVISLWGVNCGSCLDEMVALEPVYRELKDRGLEVWAVNTEQLSAGEVRDSLAQRNLSFSFPLILDDGLEITRIFTSWFIPVTVIVDREGIVQYYKIGFKSKDTDIIKKVVGDLLE